MTIGPILVLTIQHFFPELNDWIDEIEDPRFLPFVTYHKRFLFWWGLSLFLCKMGSRRQLDYQFNTIDAPELLNNINRLAGTDQETRPVHNTLNYFLGGIGGMAVCGVLKKILHRLIRGKVLDNARLQGRFVTAIDGSGYLLFRYPHCKHCLRQKHGDETIYMHQVFEGKLLGPADTVFSLGTVFIDNQDSNETLATASSEERKQDCELKAARRWAEAVRKDHPQLALCLTGDSLFGCGEGFQIAKDYKMAYVYVLKEGRVPTLWQEFQTLMPLCPEQKVEVITPAEDRQIYRWVHNLSYTDTNNRTWSLTAIQCEETKKNGEKSLWAWVTDLEVNARTVAEVATKGGRHRWHIENQGFNTQKNSGLNLEHAYSRGTQWAAYYFLLQIAHVILQLVEKGSLLLHLAQQWDKRTAVHLYGSLKNMAQRLLDSFRYLRWPEDAFDKERARKIQIRLDTS